MSIVQAHGNEERGLNPADVQNVRFTRASMLRPGYVDSEVDRVMSRVAEELARHIAEKAALRDEVRALRAAVDGVVVPEAPSDQAVRILSSAQQTADAYVAEAEEFSRQMTSEARSVYEEEVRQARENAGAIIQAAQEAAARMTGPAPAGADTPGRSVEELEEQVAYLEALITDVETEWGRADPGALPQGPPRPPAQRSGRGTGPGGTTAFSDNTVSPAPAAEEDVSA